MRAAVIGVGYFGRLHAEKLAALEGVNLVAVTDVDERRAGEVAAAVGAQPCRDYRQLFGEVDAVSIAVPTRLHYQVARDFLSHGVHVLVEKPMTTTLAEADDLIELAARRELVLQVGHIERINAAVTAVYGLLDRPLFIESHRVAPFKPRGTDVDVVFDLMIHDIDIIQSMVRSPIASVDASGISVLSPSTDIANARIHFESGCIANVTASRAGMKSERKLRLFQRDAYLRLDLQSHTLSVTRKGVEEVYPGVPELVTETTTYQSRDALRDELIAFVNAVRDGAEPLVSGEEGRRALETAIAIARSAERLAPVSWPGG